MPNIPEFEVPRGPSEQQPTADPAIQEAFSRVATSVEKQAESAERIAEVLKRIPTHQEEITRKFKNINLELQDMVEFASDTEEAIKAINAQTKSLRRGIIDTKKIEDAKKVLTSIIEAQKMIQAQTKQGTQQWAASVTIIKKLEKEVEQLANRTGDLADNEVKRLNKSLLETEKTQERMVKNFKTMTLSHITRQSIAIQRAWAAMGIGKQMAGKVEKYAKYAEIPYRMREAQQARLEENRESFRRKRETALAAVRERYGEGSIMANPAAQAALLKGMGISRRRATTGDVSYLAGEGAKTAAVAAMETHGTGMVGQVMSKSAGSLEDALGSLGGIIADLAPVLAAAEEAVLLLVKAFDMYTKQNKEMEQALAGGGLFATAAGGGGFAGAREGLKPKLDVLGLYSSLGLSFERNLGIARAIAEGGGNIQSLVTGGQEKLQTGRMSGRQVDQSGMFGPGSFGEIQRAVVGAGRVAGFTDAGGVQQILKMMDQYRTTLEYSEEFFHRITKATNAAGISTSKYISILDEVLSHFGRMNKNMEMTVNILGDLSKTGRISSEDLRNYLNFLTGGAGDKSQTGSTTQMFLYENMPQANREQMVKDRQDVFDQALKRTDAAFKGLGFKEGEVTEALSGKSNEEIQAFLTNVVTKRIKSLSDPKLAQSMTNMVDRLRKQSQDIDLAQGFASGEISGVQMGQAAKIGGADMMNSLALQREAIKFALQESGTMAEFIANPQKFGGKHPQFVGIAERMGIAPQALGENLAATQRIAADLRVKEGAKDEEKANKLLAQLGSNPEGLRLIKRFRLDSSNIQSVLKTNGDDFVEAVAGMEDTQAYWGQSIVKQQETLDEKKRQEDLKEAAKIAKQTQSTGDVIANALSTWFTEIISGIEFIANLLGNSSLFGGGIESTTSDDTKVLTDTITDLRGQIKDDNEKKLGMTEKDASKMDEQIAALTKQANTLEAIKNQRGAYNDEQKEALKAAREGYKKLVEAAMAGKPNIETKTVTMTDDYGNTVEMEEGTGKVSTFAAPGVPLDVPSMEGLKGLVPANKAYPPNYYTINNNNMETNINSPVATDNTVHHTPDSNTPNGARRPASDGGQ